MAHTAHDSWPCLTAHDSWPCLTAHDSWRVQDVWKKALAEAKAAEPGAQAVVVGRMQAVERAGAGRKRPAAVMDEEEGDANNRKCKGGWVSVWGGQESGGGGSGATKQGVGGRGGRVGGGEGGKGWRCCEGGWGRGAAAVRDSGS